MLNRDFREFIESLNNHNVRYLVVGGYAVALHGHPRYTKDLDVWIDLSRQNAENLIEAIHAFGFASLELAAQDFLTPGQVVQLGRPPNRIDLLVSVSGVEFDECYDKRIQVAFDEVMVNFIDLESLKKNKEAAGRHQDLADLENLRN